MAAEQIKGATLSERSTGMMDRETWIGFLESACKNLKSVTDLKWQSLLEQLGLRLEHFEALTVVLAEGRWRRADNPAAYLTTAVRRVHAKLAAESGEAVDRYSGHDVEQLSYEDTLNGIDDYSNWECEDLEEDAVFGLSPHLMSRVSPIYRKEVELPERTKDLFHRLNEHSEKYIPTGAIVVVDWDRVAEAAGLDPTERKVLECKLQGISRETALSQQPDERHRKSLQAAWRRWKPISKRICKIIEKSS